jgi:hypothetical protein
LLWWDIRVVGIWATIYTDWLPFVIVYYTCCAHCKWCACYALWHTFSALPTYCICEITHGATTYTYIILVYVVINYTLHTFCWWDAFCAVGWAVCSNWGTYPCITFTCYITWCTVIWAWYTLYTIWYIPWLASRDAVTNWCTW